MYRSGIAVRDGEPAGQTREPGRATRVTARWLVAFQRGHTGHVASSDLAEMVSSDCSWAAELMRRRREMYSSYSPVFWRPAKGATSLHAGFLQRQIARDEVVGLRTGHGFVIGERRRDEGFVDDFAVDDADRWDDDGRRALRAAWERLAAQGASSLRVVSAKRDLPKNGLLESLGLSLVEEWWVKPLTPSGHAETAGPVDEEGFSGHLGPAPPVYDPGAQCSSSAASSPRPRSTRWSVRPPAGGRSWPSWPCLRLVDVRKTLRRMGTGSPPNGSSAYLSPTTPDAAKLWPPPGGRGAARGEERRSNSAATITDTGSIPTSGSLTGKQTAASGAGQADLRHTETWLSLSPVNGAPLQSARRRSSVMPASCAIRSHSAGQMYRKLLAL